MDGWGKEHGMGEEVIRKEIDSSVPTAQAVKIQSSGLYHVDKWEKIVGSLYIVEEGGGLSFSVLFFLFIFIISLVSI
jgi:hypothetical protein